MKEIKVPTSLSSLIFCNGSVYSGVSGSAGELGHTTIDKDGPLCECGNRGCLETMVSTIAIEKRMKELLQQGTPSSLKKRVKNQVRFSDIVEAAKKGDKVASQVLEEAGRYLGIGIANIINLFNPGLIVIGGLITQAGDYIFVPTRSVSKKRAFRKLANEADVRITQLGETAGALGATTLVLEEFFGMS